MGEIAEMMLDGTLCEICGCVIDGTTPGYPRTCEYCMQDEKGPYDFEFNMRLINQLATEIIGHSDIKKCKKLRNLCGRIQRKIRVKIDEENRIG